MGAGSAAAEPIPVGVDQREVRTTRILAVLRDTRGQGMAEYALIILLVAIALVAALQSFTGVVGSLYNSIQHAL